VNLQQIDDRVEVLRGAVEHAEAELVELDRDEFRRLLTASPLSGDTAARWAQADGQSQLTWQWFLAVKDWLAAIVQQRGTRSSVSTELCDQLTAALDRRPAEILPGAAAPDAARPGGPAPASVDALLRAVLAGNEAVRAVVTRVAAVWQGTSTTLAALESQCSEIEQRATQAGLPAPNELAVARSLLTQLRKRCAEDPLAVDPANDGTAPIAGGLERARTAITQAIASRQNASQESADSIAQIEAAIGQLAAARESERESSAKVGGASTLAEMEHAAAELVALRDEFSAARSETNVDHMVRALAALRVRSATAQERARRLVGAAGASLAQRNELRGRLDAYRAKARAMGRGEDPELESIYREAADALFTAPCDLAHSESLVLSYQRALSPTHRAVDA
jgi:hypothetical protein